MPTPEFHVHLHVPGLVDHTAQLNRMEITMTTAAEQIGVLGAKVDAFGVIIVDVSADFAAFRAAVEAERENLTEAGQAALDAANASADATAEKLAALDAEVGDADGSDVPAEEPTDPEV